MKNITKIIGLGHEGQAIVKHLCERFDTLADYLICSSAIEYCSNEYSQLGLKELKLNERYVTVNYDALEQATGDFDIIFFIFSINNLAIVEKVNSISKKLKSRGIIAGIVSCMQYKNETESQLELLQQNIDYLLPVTTDIAAASAVPASEQLRLLCENYYRPIYALVTVMENKQVQNHYDWAEFLGFARVNKKTAFIYESFRKGGDTQEEFHPAVEKLFKFKSLTNIEPSSINHALVLIKAGENFSNENYTDIVEQFNCLVDTTRISAVFGMTIESAQDKNAIQISILLFAGEQIINDDTSLENESSLGDYLTIPSFLIKN